MKKLYLLLLLIFSIITKTTLCYGQDTILSLSEKAAQLLIIGFRGTELTPQNHIYTDIRNLKIGGVILFDYDAPSKSRPRNITSPEQLQKLNNDLQTLACGTLFISIDQEGGYVNRLKPRYGFPPTLSAQRLGAINNRDSTAFWASHTAEILKRMGFNLNFAPDTDVNINPQSPIIGKVERSFSANPQTVIKHAEIWIDEQNKQGIISAIKHFPGHGSSLADTHLGITDVTNTWKEEELLPFQSLINSGKVQVVMTSHIINRRIDTLPATLSYKTITGLLRLSIGFTGIVVSDDIAMGAIAENYKLEDAIEKSINAGVDMLILSNNGKTYDTQIASKAINIICSLVEQGKISQSRIDEAYNRVMALKRDTGITSKIKINQ